MCMRAGTGGSLFRLIDALARRSPLQDISRARPGCWNARELNCADMSGRRSSPGADDYCRSLNQHVLSRQCLSCCWGGGNEWQGDNETWQWERICKCMQPSGVRPTSNTHAQRVCACSAVFLAQRTGLSLAFLAWTAKHFTISTCSPLYDGGWLHDGRKPAADWRGALLRPQSLSFGWEYHLRTTTASVSAPSFDALMPESLSVCETSPTSLSYRSVKVATF